MKKVLATTFLTGILFACGTSSRDATDPTDPSESTSADTDSAAGTPVTATSSSTTEILPAYDSHCLDVTGISKTPGAKIQEWSCTSGANQKFEFVPFSDGTFAIEPSHDSLCFDVGATAGVAVTTAMPLTQQTCNSSAGQHWKLLKNGSTFTIATADGTRCIDVYKAGTANGTAVNTYRCDSSTNQGYDLPTLGATTTTTAPPKGSAGCGTTGITGTIDLTTTDGNGKTRDYRIMVPTNYDSSKALPLVLAFHGLGGNEQSSINFGLQNAPGASTAAIFAVPLGIPYAPFDNKDSGWDDTCNGYDQPFLTNMLNALEKDYCIDTTRVFAAGFSFGCDFVTATACCQGNKVRAIAAASCTDEYKNLSDYTTYNNAASCGATTQKPAIRYTHDAAGFDSAYAKPAFTTTSELYRSWNSFQLVDVGLERLRQLRQLQERGHRMQIREPRTRAAVRVGHRHLELLRQLPLEAVTALRPMRSRAADERPASAAAACLCAR